MGSPTRTAFVPAERLPGWLERFVASHGALTFAEETACLRIEALDGAVARLEPPWPDDGRPGIGASAADRLASVARQERVVGIVLLRRGGYAVGVARGGRLLASKVGTRHVQSRTAAGGWSQQRFARRRANQADALVEAAAQHAAALVCSSSSDYPPPEYLVPGGDRSLMRALLAEPASAPLRLLPQLAFLDVPDPKAGVLRQAAVDVGSIRVTVTDPPAAGTARDS